MIAKKLMMAALLAASAAAHAETPPAGLSCASKGYLNASTLMPQAQSNLRAVRRSGTQAEADALYAVAELSTGAMRDALIKEATAIWAAQPADARLVGQMHEQARKLMKSGNCMAAAALLRSTLPLAEQFMPRDEVQIHAVLADLVRVAAVQRDKAALLQNGPRLTAYWERQGMPEDAIASQVYSTLAAEYLKDAQYALAEPLVLRNLHNGEQKYGADHVALAPRLQDLASLYYGQLRFNEGEAAMERVATIQRNANAASAQRPLSAQQRSEADMRRLFNQGDIAGALAHGEQEVARLEPVASAATQALQAATKAREEHPPGSATAHMLARPEQQARYRMAASVGELAAARLRIAEILHAQKRYDQAQALYQQALGDIARAGGDALQTALAKSALAMLYRARGNQAAALPMQSEALELMLPLYGRDHPDVIGSARELAAMYQRQGQNAELAALAERVPALRAR